MDQIGYIQEEFNEGDNSKDIFANVKWREDCIDNRFAKRPVFGRETSLDEDMIELKKKYKNTLDEVLVQHMIDSLIIFNHNRKNIGDHYPTVSKPVIELPDVVTLTT